eukprot:9521-Heterococcus_DN1.PRE.1
MEVHSICFEGKRTGENALFARTCQSAMRIADHECIHLTPATLAAGMYTMYSSILSLLQST